MIEIESVGGDSQSPNFQPIGGAPTYGQSGYPAAIPMGTPTQPVQSNSWLSGLGSGLQSFGSSPSAISPPQFGAPPSFAAPAQQTAQLGGLIPEPQAGVDDLIALIQKLLSGGSTGSYG